METIGKIDWVEVIKNLPEQPIGLMGLITLLVGVITIVLFWNAGHKYRLAAFVLLLVGASGSFATLAKIHQDSLIPGPTAVDRTKQAEATSNNSRVERTRTLSFYDRNAHCAASRSISWHVTADTGWNIDVESIDTDVTVKSKNSSFVGIERATSQSFLISGRIANNGDCGPLWKDGRGSLGVTVSFKEYTSN